MSGHWKLKYEPRIWQQTALPLWTEGLRGIVSVVTGGGKTVFAELCILHFLRRYPEGAIFIVVPTKALLDQWIVNLQNEMGAREDEIAIFSGDEKSSDLARINLFVINSARKGVLTGHKVSAAFLIVDECHRAGSIENAKALRGDFAATLGLSATPEREYDNALSETIIPRLGPVIFEYDYVAAKKDGVIVPFSLVNAGCELLPHEAAEYNKLTRKIQALLRRREKGEDVDLGLRVLLQRRAGVSASSLVRVPVAVRLVELAGHSRAIVFHERTDAADQIRLLLERRGIPATIYHSQIGPHTRRDNLALFRKGVFQVLVCCRALDEGINVPEASVGVIASSTASLRQRIQRLGRTLRPSPDKPRASVYTIYATQAERMRLEAEEKRLGEIAEITWQTVQLPKHGSHTDKRRMV
jgi:superfamily II DNA or RNA helicase